MADMKEVKAATEALWKALNVWEGRCRDAGAYMPGLATRLRIEADELAKKYPDEINGGASE